MVLLRGWEVVGETGRRQVFKGCMVGLGMLVVVVVLIGRYCSV